MSQKYQIYLEKHVGNGDAEFQGLPHIQCTITHVQSRIIGVVKLIFAYVKVAFIA
jgi:hypothetical protein